MKLIADKCKYTGMQNCRAEFLLTGEKYGESCHYFWS